jgi:hypothetical protein
VNARIKTKQTLPFKQVATSAIDYNKESQMHNCGIFLSKVVNKRKDKME